MWSSVVSNKDDDEGGMRRIFKRSIVLEVKVKSEEFVDWKILCA